MKPEDIISWLCITRDILLQKEATKMQTDAKSRYHKGRSIATFWQFSDFG